LTVTQARRASKESPPNMSRLRSFCYLILLSWQRQARAHLMLWIALGLLAFTAFLVYIVQQQGRWSMVQWRYRPTGLTYAEHVDIFRVGAFWPQGAASGAVQQLTWSALDNVLYAGSGFFVFSNGIVFTLFSTFLLPLWTLSFATEGLGREREA
jgi:hypothetical protein